MLFELTPSARSSTSSRCPSWRFHGRWSCRSTQTPKAAWYPTSQQHSFASHSSSHSCLSCSNRRISAIAFWESNRAKYESHDHCPHRTGERCPSRHICRQSPQKLFRAMVYHLIFIFESSRLFTTILSFQKFASITESSFSFLVSFLVSSYAFECHFYILEHHFSFQEYHFCSFKEKQPRKC